MKNTYTIEIPQNNQKNAAAFEEILTQLHETLQGRKLSLEIFANSHNIAFGFTADPAVCEVVLSHIYGVVPEANVYQVNDPLTKMKKGQPFAATEFSLRRSSIYPLRHWSAFEGDSLSGLLSTFSKCETGEHAIVQIVIRPQRDSLLHNMTLQAKKRNDAIVHFFRAKYWFKRGLRATLKNAVDVKTKQRLFHSNIRIACYNTKKTTLNPMTRLRAAVSAAANFNTLDCNQFNFRSSVTLATLERIGRRLQPKPFLLSSGELAALYHLPNELEVPNLLHVLSTRQPPPKTLPIADDELKPFAATNFRNQCTDFGIKREDRRRHTYVIGKSGTGKSKLLEQLIANDIASGEGVGVLDPHGDLVDNILTYIPKERIKDVIILDPSDLEFPPGFNPLEQVPEEQRMRVTVGIIEIFKKLFRSNWSPRLEHVLRYTLLALLDTPGTTLLSILQMLSDKNYRQEVVSQINDSVVRNFWVSEFAGWSEKYDQEAITPLINKVGQFVATNMIRNIVGQTENKFDFRKIMDERKILLMKVSKGMLGEENASLLGAMVVTKLYQAAMSRADIPEKQRKDFYFYVDEFHNFATDTFDEILSEARKYRLNLTLANQYLGQLDPRIRKTVFGNVGTLISFRIGGEDAQLIAGEMAPRFRERDLINLGVRDFAIKMTVNGEVHEAFSARTLTIASPEDNFAADCLRYSRGRYCRPRAQVEEDLDADKTGPRVISQAIQKQATPMFDEPFL
ncbi:MAG: type IV secretory system conjugative DNA transfer family protein [bacterium]|nr:type IV secretory system conjugative DNA transfer family protein [bacterium]